MSSRFCDTVVVFRNLQCSVFHQSVVLLGESDRLFHGQDFFVREGLLALGQSRRTRTRQGARISAQTVNCCAKPCLFALVALEAGDDVSQLDSGAATYCQNRTASLTCDLVGMRPAMRMHKGTRRA